MDIFTSPLKPLRLRQCRHVLQMSCLDGQRIPKKWTWRLHENSRVSAHSKFQSPSNLQDFRPHEQHGPSIPTRCTIEATQALNHLVRTWVWRWDPHGLIDTPTNRSHDHMDGEGTSSSHVICQVKKNRSFLPKDVATSLMGVLQCLWISVKILVQGSLERGKDPMNRDWLRLKGVVEINPNNELMDSLNE